MQWTVTTKNAENVQSGEVVLYNDKYIPTRIVSPLGEKPMHIIMFVLSDGTTFGRNPDEHVRVMTPTVEDSDIPKPTHGNYCNGCGVIHDPY